MSEINIEDFKNSNSVLFANNQTITNYNLRGSKMYTEFCDTLKTEDLAVMGIYGGLGNVVSDWEWNSYAKITSDLEALMQDDSVKAILLCINSPGGHAVGLMECCDYIKSCASQKPIYGFIDGEACSAAYAIATSCTKLYAKRDSITGCCGCYAEAYEMKDEYVEKQGFLHKVFRSKCSPKKNLSVISNPEAQKEYQAWVDALGEGYLRYVAESRNVKYEDAEKSFGEGRAVPVEYALENGMIDGICTLEDCVNNLIGSLDKESKEEETMTLSEQFDALSAEEKKAFFAEAISKDASLVAERDKEIAAKELARVNALEELRDGSESVNSIIDAAVADGKTAEAIGLEVAKAMKANAKNFNEEVEAKANEKAKEEVADLLASSTQPVNPPSAKSDEDFLNEIVNNIQGDK